MTRYRLSYVAEGASDGNRVKVVPGATLTVYEDQSSTLLAQTIWSAPSGGVALSNPAVTGASGEFVGWLDTPQTVRISWAHPDWLGKTEDGLVVGAGALIAHTHPESDVTGLSTDLNSKSANGHTHVLANITDAASKADKTGGSYDHPAVSDYEDMVDQGADPATPTVGRHRVYAKGTGVQSRDPSGRAQARGTPRSRRTAAR
jgi:hypothetical protein